MLIAILVIQVLTLVLLVCFLIRSDHLQLLLELQSRVDDRADGLEEVIVSQGTALRLKMEAKTAVPVAQKAPTEGPSGHMFHGHPSVHHHDPKAEVK